MSLATVTPSNFPVVYTVTLTALFGLANLMQIHYLFCGHEGMEYRREVFPKITQMSAYGFLLAATANNFGTFAGTLVVKVESFSSLFFYGIHLDVIINLNGTLCICTTARCVYVLGGIFQCNRIVDSIVQHFVFYVPIQ